jgi:Tfp pilus assembly protein PilX
VLLAVFASLAAGVAQATSLNVRKTANLTEVHQARLQAEGGLGYTSYVLQTTTLPAGSSGQTLLDNLATALAGRLDGTSNLGGQTVSYDGATILIPHIATTDSGAGFTVALTLTDEGNVRMQVGGQADNGCARAVSMDFNPVAGSGADFPYGVASRGKVSMTGNARILGANEPSEANVLTATYSEPEAARLVGNCTVDGDMYVSNPDASVRLTGNINIGGESNFGGNIDDHVHIGVGDVEFPEADPSVFEPFATNIVDSGTPTSGNRTFENIRIAAGTNPNFSGNITIKGVVYIESPNNVRFTGNLNLQGVVVTEDAGDGNLGSNSIRFTGNTNTTGVESLPDQPQFTGLKALPGTFLLAPGFSTTFTGNFGTINGAMAADEFRWTGNAGGTVSGPIINWADTEFNLTGNSHLNIDLSDCDGLPPGFSSGAVTLSAMPETYGEVCP